MQGASLLRQEGLGARLRRRCCLGFMAAATVLAVMIRAGWAADGGVETEQVLQAVVKIRAIIPPNASTARNLGTERIGSGVIIDADGLILTIGYLTLEAMRIDVETSDGRIFPAEYLGYDHATGFGVLRAMNNPKARPLHLGKTADLKLGDQLMAISAGGDVTVKGTTLVAKREFAGDWEYLLDEALITAPTHPYVNGAALVNQRGDLVGIGALLVPDALPGSGIAGNMYVPIDLLRPILADLILYGRVQQKPRPWLGLYGREESQGRVMIEEVVRHGPAATAGLQAGDLIVGVAGKPISSLADFYRKIWAVGPAGSTVPVDLLRGTKIETVVIRSADSYRHLRLRQSF